MNVTTNYEMPVVVINFSEHPKLHKGQVLSLKYANEIFESLDAARIAERTLSGRTGYDKVGYSIKCIYEGEPYSYEGRYDIGDGDGSLISHIKDYFAFLLNKDDYNACVLRSTLQNKIKATYEEVKSFSELFTGYLEFHISLANLAEAVEIAYKKPVALSTEEICYYEALRKYVDESRKLINCGNYNLPSMPRMQKMAV